MNTYRAGIDIGSTTVKLVLLDENGKILFGQYRRHCAHTQQTLKELLAEAREQVGSCLLQVKITGSGSINLGKAMGIGFVQEVVAVASALQAVAPQTDVAIELGGEDAKIIYFRGGLEERMNGVCAGGTGSFIDQMASLLQTDAAGLNAQAEHYQEIYPIAARCGVFAKTDIQPLINEGATTADLAASIFQAVVNQTISGLACGKPIRGCVAFLGGPLHFLPELKKAFIRTLKLTPETTVDPENSHLFAAMGAALESGDAEAVSMDGLIDRLDKGVEMAFELKRLDPLFATREDHQAFCARHSKAVVRRESLSGYRGDCFLGIDAGSTTTKVALIGSDGQLLFSYYANNQGNPIRTAMEAMARLRDELPEGAHIARSCSTGYGESLLKSAFCLDEGEVETIAHCTAAAFFDPEVDCVLDIGGQDMKCVKLKNGSVDTILLKTIFHPCVFYEHQETPGAQNHYNCPIVVSYPENLKNNVEAVADGEVRYIRPFLAFTSEKIAADRLAALCKEEWGIDGKEVRAAVHKAWEEQQRAKADVRAEGQKALQWMAENHARGIVLAGRPYHIDPEINHGIPEMIASYDLAVLTEDSLPIDFTPERPLRVNDQWVYHSRLYSAAEFVRNREDLELIQLNSFGCGLDAVTTDQVCEILEGSNKLYTVLKIDEVNNLGAARIRIRSLLAAMNQRQTRGIRPQPKPAAYHRSEFTKDMYQSGYTILAPQMSPIHFDLLEPIFKKYGYHIEVLANDNRAAIDMGLKFVNNDACFPSITVVGQIMDAVLSGKYDTDKLAVMMTQTGGCCRASNYVGFIRRALDKAGLGHIPVISLNANGMETNEGFKLSPGLLFTALRGVVYGDLFMRCLYRVRPYEKEKGSANALHQKWLEIAIDSLVNSKSKWSYKAVCSGIVEAFDALPIDETLRKPRVGVVGEILVKYMPLANNHLVDLLEAEGAEAVVPDLIDFLNYCVYNGDYKHEFLGAGWTSAATAKLGVDAIRLIRKPALDALEKSRRFEPPMPIEQVAELAKPFLSIGNQYGEGWFLTGEMAELVLSGTPNIVCIQPFACLPNHVVGKGVIKALKKAYPQSNIVAVDYDPGASEVNQLNRIKLMLSTAKKRLAEEETAAV